MADDWASGVLPHGPLTELAPGLWSATGSIKGMPLKRNMIVARLPDGRLVVHSAVALDDENMKKLESLGDVAFILVPGPGHRLDVKRYQERYRGAKVVAPAAARAKVEQVCPVAASCEEALSGLPGFRWQAIPGLPVELAYELDVGEGTALIVNDVLGHGPPEPGFGGWLFAQLGTPGGKLALPRIVRFFQVKDRPAVCAWLAAQGERDDLRVLTTSHGAAITGDVAGQIRQAATIS